MSDLFEAAFINAGVGMALVSKEGRFIRANTAFQTLLGLTEAEMIATDFQSLTHPDDLDLDLGLLARLAAGEIPSYRMDKRYIRRDGGVVWVQLTVSAVRGSDGAPQCYISQVEDLTPRMEAEQAMRRSEARYRLIAGATRDMIATTDLEGVITFVTPACSRLLGYEPEEMVGAPGQTFVHPEDAATLKSGFDALLAGDCDSHIRWRGRHKSNDRWVWLESSPALLPPGDPLGGAFVDVVRDVSDQMAQEAALSDARAAAEAATAAKAEFLANMSHEIRTPLTAVIGFADLLRERPLDGVARGYVQRIETAGRALLTLVNDILDFSRMEAGHLEIDPRPTAPTDILDEVAAILGPAAEAKGLTLNVVCSQGGPPAIMVDADRLRQVVLNLGGNAIKFTENGGVSLRLAWDAEDETLAVTVRDTGQGLTPEQRGALFKRFSQVGPRSSRRHGAGLGLAICRTLVEAMGGRIDVRSQPGEGSVFSFRIPAPAAELEAVEPFKVNGGLHLAGVRVMVVDDNESNRRLARAVLESQGAEIAEAKDGLVAVELAKRTPCDVIVMDIRMPELDGPGALRRIRAEPGPNRNVPILAFTAGSPDAALAEFDDVVPKPLLADTLLSTVRRAVEGVRV
jgi:PAS domain S-box-containing protein